MTWLAANVMNMVKWMVDMMIRSEMNDIKSCWKYLCKPDRKR